MRLYANEILAGRYRLESMIGEGGMGMVWRAHDHQEGREVAIKFVKDTAGPDEVRRFLREARASMAVEHPNVVKIFSVETSPDGSPMMVMELLEGEPLSARLAAAGRLTLSECADVLLPIVSAVGSAHAKGVVHRDLKPDNVFLAKNPQGGAPVPRVLDFGIAKLTALEGDAKSTGGLTSTGTLLGTPYYMSPEQVFGDKSIDHRADIWSLGVMLYECLSGRKPVDGDSLGQLLRVITTASMPPLRTLAADLPEDVLTLSERMLRVERAERPTDLREVYTVLRAYSSARASPFAGATLKLESSAMDRDSGQASVAVAPVLTPDLRGAGPVSASVASSAMPSASASRLAWIWPVVGVLAVGGGVAAFAARDLGKATTAAPPPSADAVAPSAVASSPIDRASASASGPPASGSPAGSASAPPAGSSLAAASAASAARPSGGPVRPKASSSAPASASTASVPPTSATAPSLPGVVTANPYNP